MRRDGTGMPVNPEEEGSFNPGYYPDPPSEGQSQPNASRVITSSGEALTGGVAVGSAADRKQPDLWARQHGTNTNMGPGTIQVETEDPAGVKSAE
jgi:hypothetical protein